MGRFSSKAKSKQNAKRSEWPIGLRYAVVFKSDMREKQSVSTPLDTDNLDGYGMKQNPSFVQAYFSYLAKILNN